MVVRKRKKSRKLRGRTRTMGWGRVGQHRKSGSKGGVGAVGFHKHKIMWMIKYAPEWYGKHGFTSVQQLRGAPRIINVGEINEIVLDMIAKNAAIKEEGMVVFNAIELGYDKVLGKGEVTVPIKLIAKHVSETAKRKIEEAGGVVLTPQ
ncbi:MAG: uL15 family ribosomal protein [Desulfurococcaceae archaeon]